MYEWNRDVQQPKDVTHQSSYFPAAISLEEELGSENFLPKKGPWY